jgi:hypothetical protein
MIKSAKYYIENGISVIPTGVTKAPHRTISSWTQFQNRLMTPQEVECLFEGASGIATIGGVVSGGRVHIDFDTKYDITGSLYEDFKKCISDIDPTLESLMVVVKTPSGGYHWIYNIDPPVIPSMKLAQRPTTEEELEHNPNEKVKVLIETKGDKGYCLAPPSTGYSFVSERKFPIKITADQQELILETARMFDTVPASVVTPPKKSVDAESEYIESPFEAFNKDGSINDILLQYGWKSIFQKGSRIHYKRPGDTHSKTSGDYNTDLNLFKVFTTSTQFEPNKGYSPSAVYCVLNCNGDWKQCYKELIEKGYGKKRKIISSKFSVEISKLKEKGADRDKIIESIRQLGNTSIEETIEIIDNYESNQGKSIKQFWDVTSDKNDKKKITILLNKYIKFLTENFNIYRYRLSNKDGEDVDSIFRYVQITDNVIREVKITDIKDLITDYVKGLEFVFDGIYRDALMEVIQQKTATLFSHSQLEFLDYCNVDILKDTRDIAYFPFKNTIVCVDRNGIHTMDYKQIDGKVIWRDKIINRTYEQNNDYNSFSFYRFIEKLNNDDQSRIEYFSSCLGYIMHGYKDELNPVCVILGEEVANSKEGGGAGKGLVTQAISKVTNQVIIDGKGFKADKPFLMQRVSLGTQLIVIQDTDERFDFESLFSKITDGLTIEKKNKDELFLPYSDSPKFLITTNYTIPNTSSAAKRRQRLIEFSSFFNSEYTPFDFLGEYLFYTWTQDEWNKFYTIMFDFISFYFQKGLLKITESETSREKRIVTNFTQDFYDYFIDLSTNVEYELAPCYFKFLQQNDIDEKNYSKIRFSRALDDAAQAFKYHKEKRKDPYTKKSFFVLKTDKNSVIEKQTPEESSEPHGMPF